MTTDVDRIQSRSVISILGQRFRDFLKRLYRQPASAFGTTIFLLFTLMALVGPVIAPYDANEQIYGDARQSPSTEHWFGTDPVGRDIYARAVHGSRISLLVATSVVVTVSVFGLIIGLPVGYYRRLDNVVMRILDGIYKSAKLGKEIRYQKKK